MVMKNTYVKPEMQVEEFLANNYCASTCTSGTKYLFTCKTDSGNNDYYRIYKESGLQTGLQTSGSNKDELVYNKGFHGCGKQHEADTQDVFATGYITNNSGGNVKDVMIWFEGSKSGNYYNAEDIHVTNNLNKESWTIVKS